MIRKLPIALIGAMTATAVLLAGCAGGTTTEPEQPADQPSQPAASPSQAGNPSEQSQPSDDGDGEKPSKEELVAGLIKFYQSTQGLSEAKAKKFAECMADEMYDKAKTKTLIAMKDGNPAQADPSDANLIAEAGVACAPALT